MDWVWLIVRIGGVPAFLLGALYFALLGQVWGQKSGKAKLELVDPKSHPEKFSSVAEYQGPMENCGFEWVGAYVYSAPFNSRTFMACWRRASDGVYAACYVVGGKTVLDFVSSYTDGSGLTTCTSAAAMLYPQLPGIYKQAFTEGDVVSVLQKHSQGDEYLRKAFNLSRARVQSLEELVVRDVEAKAKRIWKIWFFPARSLYWYSQMGKKANVPVWEQALLAPAGSGRGAGSALS